VPPPRPPLTDDVWTASDRTQTDGGLTQGVLGHRLDIQGLRAVAVLLVVLGHAGVWFLRGGFIGVDVFFVLSGFLITRLMLEEAGRNRSVSLSRFYARRAKRILPAAALTLIVTGLAARFLMNVVRAEQAVVDGVWAAFFAANVQFARQGVDYFAQGNPPSPVQHYWSLAVEEQFYLAWPLLLSVVLIGIALHRRRGGDPSRLNVGRLAAVITVAGLGSLAWSVTYTPRTPAAAYFSTLARAWELALGAGLAIGAARFLRLSDRTRAFMGWGGVLAIGAAAVAFSAATPFPGYAALLPTVGTALVIAAGIGDERSRGGIGRWLGIAPLRYVGDRSYAFYLWHWPALTIAAFYVGHDLGLGTNLLLLAGAFVLSIASYGLVENPIRRAKLARPIRTSALLWGTSVGLVLAFAAFNLGSIGALGRSDGPLPRVTPFTPPSGGPTPAVARVLPEVVASVEAARRGEPIPATLYPPLNRLYGDNYHFPREDCFAENGEQSIPRICRMGPNGATRTMVVFGDSHARHWMPPILWTAREDGWRVLPLVELGCGPSHYAAESPPGCASFVDWAVEQVRSLKPDVVLIGGQFLLSSPEQVRANVTGTRELVAAMVPLAKDVVVIGDPPAHRQQPVDCLYREDTLAGCTLTRTDDQIWTYRNVARATEAAGGRFLNTLGWFCFEHQCPMVIGNTIAFRDDSHVSVTYALQLRELFRDALNRARAASE
jgi:peptidoglycan/LPS O-acetylase OafA/YrhL